MKQLREIERAYLYCPKHSYNRKLYYEFCEYGWEVEGECGFHSEYAGAVAANMGKEYWEAYCEYHRSKVDIEKLPKWARKGWVK